MDKYIKLEDAIEAYNQAVTNLVESEMEEFNLGDFTECSFNTTQIKLIARMIESLPTIEVSEDCISREYLLSKVYDMDNDNLVVDLKDIEDAPSVVPAYQPITIKTDEKDSKSLKEQLKDIKTPGILMTEEEYGLFGCRVRTVEHAPSVVPTVRKTRTTAEPQTYITEDRDTQILDAWQVHHRNITTVEDEPTTEQSSAVYEWIKEYKGNGWNDYWDYTCPVCGKKYERGDSILYDSSFCPNCGSRMRGIEE